MIVDLGSTSAGEQAHATETQMWYDEVTTEPGTFFW
jgi:hypothetical protein